MANVQFTDNSVKVIDAMSDAIHNFLEEAGGEIEAQTVKNSRTGKIGGGQTKGAWAHVVDDSAGTVTIGNPLENAIWDEFGTGEYALNGDGRKGGWYIPIGSGKGEISQATVDAYGFRVVYGKGGKTYAYTTGKKPNRALHNAFESKKSSIKARAEKILKSEMK